MITYILCLLCFVDMSLSHSLNVNHTLKHDDDGLVPRVYNGWPAKLGDVPYQFDVRRRDDNLPGSLSVIINFIQISFKRRIRGHHIYASFCGGVIVAPSKLLSAAHCFAEKPNMCDKLCGGPGKLPRKMVSHLFAVAGQLTNVATFSFYDSVERGQWRRLKGVRYPPEYNFPKLDFAIVFLRNPFKFDSYVNAIPYASRFTDYDGKCLVSGFGRTSPKVTSDKLLLAHLTLIPWKRCNRMHRKKMRHFVCTSSQFTDVGKGDSGGPLVCANTGDPREGSKGILVGIVSGHAYGVGSFFTRVSSFYKYVERNKSSVEDNTYVYLTLVLNLLHWRFLLF